MRILNDIKYDFSDVLIVPKRSDLTSRNEVDLCRDFHFLNSKGVYSGVPIISANMDHTGTFEMARVLDNFNISTAITKHYKSQELVDFYNNPSKSPVFYSMGIRDIDYEKFKKVNEIIDSNITYICIDVANGYSEPFVNFVSKVRQDFPHITIMAGNVVTPEMTEQLLISGADIVKVGIGPGSMCTTRTQTGVGYPQLSAIIECADAAHGLGGHICADGGCRVPADVAKAFGAGADFVMIGGMLAGHDECSGEIEYKADGTGRKWKRFYGMSSKTAMDKHHGGVAEYRSSEGKTQMIPYKGKVEDTVRDILGGLRSTCTYTGSRTLKELSKRTTFIKVNRVHEPFSGGS